MAHIYDTIKGHFDKDRIAQIAGLLEEQELHVKKAVNSITSGLLGVFVKKGRHLQMTEILEEGGKLDILSDIIPICDERPTQNQQRIGDAFLQQLLGDRAADFSDPIAEDSGISKPATNRLVSMIAPVVAGVLGEQMLKERLNITTLIDRVEQQKNSFAALIPVGVVKAFDLGHLVHPPKAAPATEAKVTPPPTPVSTAPAKAKKKNSWLTWLILILLFLLLIFLWRSCERRKDVSVSERETVTVAAIPTPKPAETKSNTNSSSTDVILPNGVKLQAKKGGVEDKMIAFLQSDEYKNATEAQLKNKWFEFDNLDFEFDSSTKLMEQSQVQLDNIAAILKYFKDAKIVIGGFADKVGSEQVNLTISQQRAKTIATMLAKAGLKEQVSETEGFGERFAEHNTKESNEARATDRDIALRFVK